MVEQIKQLIHSNKFSKTDQLLLILSFNKNQPKTVNDIKEIAIEIGIPSAKKLNISQLLGGSRNKAIKTPNGWELGPLGIERVNSYGIYFDFPETIKIADDLRSITNQISDLNIQSFLKEAISSLENKSYRSAVIVSWIGAVAVLYNFILKNKLAELNIEAKNRNPKWKNAVSFDDLADMKEDSFLDICHKISVIGKSAKDELKSRLKMRNGAGHPNSFLIGENMVKAHIESLIKNVYQKF
ncbi:MAG: hypothetical protein OQJ97_05940 [Rhodospirillales bacterium]|nr:hypothetical protein [Rhodospirillales bacterium]